MVKEIVKDIEFLSVPLKSATKDDLYIIQDLLDTAMANEGNCLGLTANQIGYDKRIIVVNIGGKFKPFINPVIAKRSKETYMASEGCLSLEGMRDVKRHRSIMLVWVDEKMKSHSANFGGLVAEIIQHEVDHCSGKLI